MNYLAHAYLSFSRPDILCGNMISDFVKGKKKYAFEPGIQQGIALHRAIDLFTDTHPATAAAKSFFKEAYGLYAGPLVDIVYDYFLANDPTIFPKPTDLAAFTQDTYRLLRPYAGVFPEKFVRLFHYMQMQDWLYNYRHLEGIRNSFAGLARRALYMQDHQQANTILEQHQTALQHCYEDFFPQVSLLALNTLRQWQGPEGGQH